MKIEFRRLSDMSSESNVERIRLQPARRSLLALAAFGSLLVGCSSGNDDANQTPTSQSPAQNTDATLVPSTTAAPSTLGPTTTPVTSAIDVEGAAQLVYAIHEALGVPSVGDSSLPRYELDGCPIPGASAIVETAPGAPDVTTAESLTYAWPDEDYSVPLIRCYWETAASADGSETTPRPSLELTLLAFRPDQEQTMRDAVGGLTTQGDGPASIGGSFSDDCGSQRCISIWSGSHFAVEVLIDPHVEAGTVELVAPTQWLKEHVETIIASFLTLDLNTVRQALPTEDATSVTIMHPVWGATRLVTSLPVSSGPGSIIAYDMDGAILWSWYSEFQYTLEPWGTTSGTPSVDAAGHVFFRFNPGRYDGVIILVPTSDGFDDFGSLPAADGSTEGRFYSADVVDDNGDGIYEVVVATNDCNPDCAGGSTTFATYRWDGIDFRLDGTGL